MTVKIRLFVDHPLGEAQLVPLDRDQANYLFAVMRLSVGDAILVFNGKDGEWQTEIEAGNKKSATLKCIQKTKALQEPPDVWLFFAPIKKARTDFIVEKATELGAAAIFPISTDFTNSERIRQDRLQAHAIEATEQCGGTYVPTVHELQKLNAVLDQWPHDRRLLYCDEGLVGAATAFSALPSGKWAILIGPEGGFSDRERTKILNMQQSFPVSLGPRILRADTAAVTALSLLAGTFRGLVLMRQDAIETLQRFSGLIIALCTISLGLYWILNSFGLLMLVGYPVTFIGIALGYSAIQRLRFHRNNEGQGIVHFVEGQITYFGPESGGIVAVGDITRVVLLKIGRENVWVIEQPAQPALVIPTNAQGADRLFDAFVLLPNWNVEFTLSRLEDNQSHEDVIWQSNQYLDQSRYIH